MPAAKPTRKRVALFLPNLGGGGAERVALVLANELVSSGHEVDLVLIGAGGELIPLLSPKVRLVELKASRMITALPGLVRYFREQAPDAIHAFMWPATVIAIMAHRLARSAARLIVSDHTTYSKHLKGTRQRIAFRWSTRLFYPLADARIACSEAVAEDLARLACMPRSRFEVVYSPISPPKRLKPSPTAESLWDGAQRRIISVGSLNPVKNHALLIRAFSRLEDKTARLMILGQGPERARLEKLARDLGVADRVIMPGFTVDPWPYLASASLFVFSSDYEGSPVALAEAMYAGLGIVSTDCPSGPRELLDGGRYGRLVPCGDEDALAAAIGEELGRQVDAAAMRARAEDVTGRGSLERYSALFVA